MFDVMIDLETLSTTDEHPIPAILTLAAIKFDPFGDISKEVIDYKENKISNVDSFYCKIDLDDCEHYGMGFSEHTLNWWAKQDQSAIDEAFSPDNRLHLDEAMRKFYRWYGRSGDVWSHSSTFDIIVLERIYRELLKKQPPWQYHDHSDTRTLFKRVNPEMPTGGIITPYLTVGHRQQEFKMFLENSKYNQEEDRLSSNDIEFELRGDGDCSAHIWPSITGHDIDVLKAFQLGDNVQLGSTLDEPESIITFHGPDDKKITFDELYEAMSVIEEKAREEELRNKYPELNRLYRQYKMMAVLLQDLDNNNEKAFLEVTRNGTCKRIDIETLIDGVHAIHNQRKNI